MKNKNTQFGRSMVEMLGVLAIIGVLSIGGIAGYTMAMNRYKANQILDVVTKLMTYYEIAKSRPSFYDNGEPRTDGFNYIALQTIRQEMGFERCGIDSSCLMIQDARLYFRGPQDGSHNDDIAINASDSVISALKSITGASEMHSSDGLYLVKNGKFVK